MTDHLQTPDEWLLAQYDNETVAPGNHVRPLFELVADCPARSTEEWPRWSGHASWPQPQAYADLDRRDAAAARLDQLTARRTA